MKILFKQTISSNFGIKIPKPVKKTIMDEVAKIYSENAAKELLKEMQKTGNAQSVLERFNLGFIKFSPNSIFGTIFIKDNSQNRLIHAYLGEYDKQQLPIEQIKRMIIA